MVEDLSAFFSATDFATQATLNGVGVLGIFDQPYLQALEGIATTGPVFTLPTAQAAATQQGATLLVAGGTYRVRSVQHDGTGVTALQLEQRS